MVKIILYKRIVYNRFQLALIYYKSEIMSNRNHNQIIIKLFLSSHFKRVPNLFVYFVRIHTVE